MAAPVNILWPGQTHGQLVPFVGGLPQRIWQSTYPLDTEREYHGEIISKEPVYANGEWWVRMHVPGFGDDIMVNLANLR